MKCPVCWADKAYVHPVNGWKALLYHVLMIVPLKCHHCYHKFSVSWFATIGKTVHPPKVSKSQASSRRSFRGPRPRTSGGSSAKPNPAGRAKAYARRG